MFQRCYAAYALRQSRVTFPLWALLMVRGHRRRYSSVTSPLLPLTPIFYSHASLSLWRYLTDAMPFSDASHRTECISLFVRSLYAVHPFLRSTLVLVEAHVFTLHSESSISLFSVRLIHLSSTGFPVRAGLFLSLVDSLELASAPRQHLRRLVGHFAAFSLPPCLLVPFSLPVPVAKQLKLHARFKTWVRFPKRGKF